MTCPISNGTVFFIFTYLRVFICACSSYLHKMICICKTIPSSLRGVENLLSLEIFFMVFCSYKPRIDNNMYVISSVYISLMIQTSFSLESLSKPLRKVRKGLEHPGLVSRAD